tara:strand:- start:787 stop:1113 length:327 start_codon:yes stop_codon:yes gene_type:complete
MDDIFKKYDDNLEEIKRVMKLILELVSKDDSRAPQLRKEHLQLLTIDEVQACLQLTRSSISRKEAEGKLRRVFVNGQPRYNLIEVAIALGVNKEVLKKFYDTFNGIGK